MLFVDAICWNERIGFSAIYTLSTSGNTDRLLLIKGEDYYCSYTASNSGSEITIEASPASGRTIGYWNVRQVRL